MVEQSRTYDACSRDQSRRHICRLSNFHENWEHPKPCSGRVLKFIENPAADSSKNRFGRRIQILSLAWYRGDSTIVPELVTILGVEKLKRSRLLNTVE